MKRIRNMMFTLLVIVVSYSTGNSNTWQIILKAEKSAPVIHGVNVLQNAMHKKELRVSLTTDPPQNGSTHDIWICDSSNINNDCLKSVKISLPAQAESFVIRKTKNAIVLAGTDAVGIMYACIDLAEQFRLAQKISGVKQIQERSETPFLAVRAVNPFLHRQAMLDTNSWYFCEEYWQDYLNLLAETRHNVLDIHAVFDLRITNMPNIFPYFFSFDEYPDTGIPPYLTRKIFQRFKRIVVMAKERGIRVAFMNYNASVSSGEEELSGERLVDYTQRCVRQFLEETPDLWAFGFRVGESGQSEDFFERAYLEPIRDIAPHIQVYTRTWGAIAQKLMQMGHQFPGQFIVEPKYNGEQLGLPYQGIVSPIEANLPPSYSYEAYPVEPQPWQILWQVRANGTHRIFNWGDPDFVRRTVLSCQLGRGIGYTVEPLSAYYAVDDAYHRTDAPDGRWYRWNHQRTWFWYHLWGRFAYDPDTPESVWKALFAEKFGEAGESAYEALRQASKIVPLIYSYHRLGPDHRQMAPEMEVGNDAFALADMRVPGTLEDFVHCPALDTRTFQSIQEFVRAWMNNPPNDPLSKGDVHAGGDSPAIPDHDWLPTGKIGPYEVIHALNHTADAIDALLPFAATQPSPALTCLEQDLNALKWLGRYYVHKIKVALHYAFFMENNDLEQILNAYEELRQAQSAWSNLAEIADAHYGPLPEWLRMKTDTFTWAGEGEKLKRDEYDLDRALAAMRKQRPLRGNAPVVSHTPRRFARAGEELRLSAFVYARTEVHATLYYKSFPTDDMKKIPMLRNEELYGVYEAMIPAAEIKTGKLEYFLRVETHGPNLEAPEIIERPWEGIWFRYDSVGARIYFPEGEGKNWYSVTVAADDHVPAISLLPSKIQWLDESHFRLTLRARIEDQLGIQWAKVYFKPLPSYMPWHQIPMSVESADVWETEFVVDHRGALFYLEAANHNGMATCYPDIRFTTPYEHIPSWDAAQPSAARTQWNTNIERGTFWQWDPQPPDDYNRALWEF
ncbi:hypothetical protein JXJ21_00390 [candidate division KSB1 bacterium]|nr:hypothetical protein [candidate division KSB1 bacterium]